MLSRGIFKGKLFLAILLLILFSLGSLGVFSLTDRQIPLSFFGGKELFSPSDWVKEEQIKVYPNKVVLDLKDVTWAGFTDTNSMDPFIDDTANTLEIIPENPDSINIGDVISYQTDQGVIIHRVVEKGQDERGFYYFVKGDNNSFKDPLEVRFEEIKGVVVAVIY